MSGISYTAVGGVETGKLPGEYPEVLDRRKYPRARSSGNYWPDWSRAAFMDIRNVDGLTLQNLDLRTLRPDGRPPVIVENCSMKGQGI